MNLLPNTYWVSLHLHKVQWALLGMQCLCAPPNSYVEALTPSVIVLEGRAGTSLVAQWLRIRLPMQGTQVRALVREDPTRRGATKPTLRSC